MKSCILAGLLVLGAFISASGATFSYVVGATIPDGDLNGYQNSQTVGGLSGPITDVNVTLDISGGFNGDFYAYLTHNGTTAILLNRVGRSATHAVGYPDAGFGQGISGDLFTLDDQASQDVHSYRSLSYTLNSSGQLTGQWQPDGRGIDPLSPGATFDSAARSGMLSVFNRSDPNGVWSLYVADVSSGGEGTLAGWGLQITTVPEPSVVGLLGSALAALFCFRRTGRNRS
jgi:subtilisin-like proprotein convertase family protein